MQKKRSIRLMAVAMIAVIVALIIVFRNKDNSVEASEETNQPIAVSQSSDGFTTSVNEALNEYYSLSNALVKADAEAAKNFAASYAAKVDSLALNEYRGDTTILQLVRSLTNGIASHSKELAQETDVEKQREHYEMVSGSTFDLLRTIQYNGGKVYMQYCPMAFDNRGASWLSNQSEIINPYFGDKMLHCGELKDSIGTASL